MLVCNRHVVAVAVVSFCQYFEQAFTVENIFISPRPSIHLSMRRRGSETDIVTALNFRYLTQKESEQYFLCGNTMSAIQSVVTCFITVSVIFRLISAAVNCHAIGPSRYCAE